MDIITLTETAINELKRIIKEQEFSESMAVRLGVKGGGCSGFSYTMDFEDKESGEEDKVIKTDGISIYVDPKSLQYLDGMVVDFHEDLMQRGFVFKNPNSTATCGCGQSFSV